VDISRPPKPDALAIAVPEFLNPGPAVSRQLAVLRGPEAALDSIKWLGMGGDKVSISLKPLPPPSMKSTMPDRVDLAAIIASARHTISIDPNMAAKAQANPSAAAVNLLG